MSRGIFIFILFFASSCSVYKSAVRGEFENRAPDRLIAAQSFGLEKCEALHPLAAWIEKEFPGAPFEVLVAEPDLEVWQRTDPKNGFVEIRSYHLNSKGETQACSRTFETEEDWDLVMESYLLELDQITLD